MNGILEIHGGLQRVDASGRRWIVVSRPPIGSFALRSCYGSSHLNAANYMQHRSCWYDAAMQPSFVHSRRTALVSRALLPLARSAPNPNF